MDKKDANALMRKKYGDAWHERAGAKVERDALMRGASAPRASAPRASAPAASRAPAAPATRAPAPVRAPARAASIFLAFNDGSSNKVYELHQSGSSVRVLWGRAGAKLQEQVKDFDSAAGASAWMTAQARAKTAKGYRAASGAASDIEDEDDAPAPAPAPAPARAPRAPAPAPAASRTRSSGPPAGVMLAKPWDGTDPTGWWMSEKLDGMRAYWTGSDLFTRNGNPIAAPTWFTDLLPAGVALDGEVYMGRGLFQETMSVARKLTASDPRWSELKYMAFDAPDVAGGCEKRFAALQAYVDAACARWSRKGPCPIVYVDQIRCTSPAHLKKVHAEIERLRGEGVMLRKSGSAYSRTRTSDLLKVKNFHDEEARITGYTKGTGKHAGKLGAYEAKLVSSGVAFKIGTGISDAERARPLKIGTIVTVSYQELTRDGVPRFPSLVGARDYE